MHLSFRTKLILSYLGLVSLSMLILAYYMMRSSNHYFIEAVHSRMEDELALITERTGPLLAMGNREGVQSFLEAIGPHVMMKVMIADTEGTIVGSTEPEDANLIGRPGRDFGLPNVLRSRLEKAIFGDTSLSKDAAYMVAPVEWGGHPVGSIRLSYRLSDLYAQNEGLADIIMAGLAVAAAVGVGVSLMLAQSLSAPTRRLVAAARGLSSGDLSTRTNLEGRDEIREAGMALDLMAERLQTMEIARQQLLGDVAHDLHSSVTGVTMAAEALGRGAIEDPAMRPILLDGLASHGQRLHRMADDLLEAARIESGRLQLRLAPVQPGSLLAKVSAEFAAEAAQQGVLLEVESQGELPELVADGARIAQALGNLVENAIRYTPSGKKVVIGGSVADGVCSLYVRDQGPGMSGEDLSKLFDRFHRFSEEKPGRLGFGLSIAKGLAEAHGGSIVVESEGGNGATFRIAIPLQKDPSIPEFPSTPPAATVLQPN